MYSLYLKSVISPTNVIFGKLSSVYPEVAEVDLLLADLLSVEFVDFLCAIFVGFEFFSDTSAFFFGEVTAATALSILSDADSYSSSDCLVISLVEAAWFKSISLNDFPLTSELVEEEDPRNEVFFLGVFALSCLPERGNSNRFLLYASLIASVMSCVHSALWISLRNRRYVFLPEPVTDAVSSGSSLLHNTRITAISSDASSQCIIRVIHFVQNCWTFRPSS